MKSHHENSKSHATAHPPSTPHHGDASGHDHPYRQFAVMVALMFVAMFWLMYAMVDHLANVYLLSLNQVYMAALMTGAMVVIELVLMRAMYPNKRRNAVLAGLGVIVTVLSWVAIREQTGIGDRQFLRAMIPHHEGALLMCREAPLTDERIQTLCRQILESQQREIDQMKQWLAEAEAG